MKYKFIAYFLFSTVLPIIANSQSVVSKFKYEDGYCAKAIDALDGRPLRWFKVNMSECGFDMSKPTRVETQISAGACRQVDVYESTLRYGTVRKVYTQIGGLSRSLPLFLTNSKIKFSLSVETDRRALSRLNRARKMITSHHGGGIKPRVRAHRLVTRVFSAIIIAAKPR